MIFPKFTKVELAAASKEWGRPILENAYLSREQAVLIAADGIIMVVVPVTVEDNDVSGPIPDEALAAARLRALDDDAVLLAGAEELTTGNFRVTREAPNDRKFPDWRGIVAKARELPGQHYRIVFDIGLLLKLAEAIGEDHAMLFDIPLGDGSGAITVEAYSNDSGAFGVLMPMHVDTMGMITVPEPTPAGLP